MEKTETTHLNWAKETETDDWVFSGRVNNFDLMRLDLDELDKAVVLSPIKSAADFFQNMEIIFRRLGEQNAIENKIEASAEVHGK